MAASTACHVGLAQVNTFPPWLFDLTGKMPRQTAFSTSLPEQLGTVQLTQLNKNQLQRLCQALEAAAFLPAAPGELGRPANTAYLLDSLQHPKANKLIQYSPTGPELKIKVLTVKDLKVLALHLQAPVKSSDTKDVIVASITNSLTGTYNWAFGTIMQVYL